MMAAVGALVKKDFTLLFRNKVLSILPLAVFALIIVLYFLLPGDVDETMNIGIYGLTLPEQILDDMAVDGIVVTALSTEEELKESVSSGDAVMGIIFPSGLSRSIKTGEKLRVTAVFSSTAPSEMVGPMVKIAEQLMLVLHGDGVALVKEEEYILGPDMAGKQIPARDRLIPIFAGFIILMEIMGLGTLIAEEFDRDTLSSILITSTSIGSVLTAKAITGVGITFVQALILLGVSGALFSGPLLLVTGLFFGSLLVAGLGFLIAAISKNMMTVIAWSMLVMIVLFMPALNVLLPGLVSDWIKIIPSYYLTNLIFQVAHFDAGWMELWRDIIFLIIFDFLFISIGVTALKRRRI
ncbi:MAG: ABC transporter permease [Spirochaetales bacterium]|nr:ABC transporter permease [Spirochaetales bacterium]